MKEFKRAARWLFLLCKRLMKKPEFPIIMALIPLLVIALGIVSRQDNGIVSIALSAQDFSDPLAAEIMDSLHEGDTLIRFISASSPARAERLVESGNADGAWIFADNLQETINNFSAGTSKKAAVYIIEREDTIPLMLARERLNSKIYPYSSRAMYKSFIRREITKLDGVSDEELNEFYDSIKADGDLFEFSYTDPDEAHEEARSSYLIAPLRGLMAVLMMLCGLTAAMFFIKDNEAGVFAMIPRRKKALFAIVYQFVPLILIAPIILICLKLSGLWTGTRELLSLISYMILVTGFCLIFRRLCRTLRILGSLTPIAIILMLVLCPVFIEIGGIRPLQVLLPPYYYLTGAHDSSQILIMALGGFGLIFAYVIVSHLTEKE